MHRSLQVQSPEERWLLRGQQSLRGRWWVRRWEMAGHMPIAARLPRTIYSAIVNNELFLNTVFPPELMLGFIGSQKQRSLRYNLAIHVKYDRFTSLSAQLSQRMGENFTQTRWNHRPGLKFRMVANKNYATGYQLSSTLMQIDQAVVGLPFPKLRSGRFLITPNDKGFID